MSDHDPAEAERSRLIKLAGRLVLHDDECDCNPIRCEAAKALRDCAAQTPELSRDYEVAFCNVALYARVDGLATLGLQEEALTDMVKAVNERSEDAEAYEAQTAELERVNALCHDLVGEELLHQEGSYKTEMRILQNESDSQQAELERLRKCVKEEWDGVAANRILADVEELQAELATAKAEVVTLRRLCGRAVIPMERHDPGTSVEHRKVTRELKAVADKTKGESDG